MYESKKKYFYGTGRRKSSVARVRVYENGTGSIIINGRDIDDFFGLETLKLIVRQPLVTADLVGKVDVVVTVAGGGVSGQAGAIRHGISRALLVLYKENPEANGFGVLNILKDNRLSLGELGCATCSLQAVLLSFLHSGVAGQETSSLQSSAVLGVQAQQSAGDAVTDSAGLTGNAAASDGDNNVNLANQIGSNQGLTNDQLQGLQTEVIVDVAAVDDDRTGAVLVNTNTGNGGLTTAGAVKILLLALVHVKLPPITGSKLRASEQRGDAQHPCTGERGSWRYGQ